jgi:transcriptional regulator with XRE-family HTH domain
MTDRSDEPSEAEVTRRLLVADEINSWIGRRRTSAKRLATAMDVSPTYLYRRLNAETAFSTDDLFHLADLLNVPADVFLHVKRADGLAAWPRPPVAVRPARRSRVRAAGNDRRPVEPNRQGASADAAEGARDYRSLLSGIRAAA